MLAGTSMAGALVDAAVSMKDASTALVIGGVGLAVTTAAIAGIVALARLLSKSKSGAVIAVSVVGIVCLVGFALAGLALTGCSAMLS